MSDLSEAMQEEYSEATQTQRDKDHKGRDLAQTMTEREIQVETLILLRAFGDALEELGNNPMLRAIPGMSGAFNFGGK